MAIVRKQKKSATSTAVDWDFSIGDDATPVRITINFDSAPTTSENVVLTIKDADTVADSGVYDEVIYSQNASGATTISFTDFPELSEGDTLNLTFDNTDTVSCTGVYTFIPGASL